MRIEKQKAIVLYVFEVNVIIILFVEYTHLFSC